MSGNKLPKFLIIGMAKCGTTSLHDSLGRHSKINPSRIKELYFFNNIAKYKKEAKYYKSLLPYCKNDEICFESTPHYLRFMEVPSRVKYMLPKSKFILLLRNPITRATSQAYGYLRQCTIKGEKPITKDMNNLLALVFNAPADFVDYHKANILKYYARNLLTWGCYHKYLANWLNYFPKSKFLIIKSEDFFKDSRRIINQCFDFVGVEQEYIKIVHRLKGDLLNKKMMGKLEYKKITKENKEQLKKYFKPYNQKLYNLINRNMNWENEI